MAERENFGGQLAVILAMAGSAIGLGNIWRFPYIMGEYGGAAFILVYIVACAVLALPIFFAESVIGRRGRSGALGSLRSLAPGSAWKFVGYVATFTPFILLGYYSVVGGWSVGYFANTVGLPFSRFNPLHSVLAHTIFMGATAVIVLLGVKNGIEKFSKPAIPTLFALIVAIAIYGLTLPGAGEGVRYLVRPAFSKLSAEGVAAAMGQAFFSLSLGVGTILIYASYSKKEDNLCSMGTGTVTADLLFAIVAGFAIIPAVFAAGIEPGMGPGLVFETLPYVFSTMGLAGGIVAFLFFFTLLIAALTSSISVLEVTVAYVQEEWGLSRKNATLVSSLIIWAVGVVCCLSGHTFDFMDNICSNWLMPLGGLGFTLFVGWRLSRADVRDEFTNGGTINRRLFPAVYFLIRYVAPVGIIAIFLWNLFQ